MSLENEISVAILKRMFGLARVLSDVHIGDNDCLGDAAKELNQYLNIIGVDRAKDIDC
jgi:hypothetical protein